MRVLPPQFVSPFPLSIRQPTSSTITPAVRGQLSLHIRLGVSSYLQTCDIDDRMLGVDTVDDGDIDGLGVYVGSLSLVLVVISLQSR
jgi:hypothetical protein